MSGKRAWLKYSFMVLKLRSFLVAVQEEHFVSNFSQFDFTYFWMQCNPSLSMYPRFPGQLSAWLVTDTQVFPAFDCPVFPVVSHYHLQNILLGQQNVWDTQPGPPVVPWVYCWFTSSLLLGTECTRKEITIFLPLFRYGMKVEAFIPEAICNLWLLPLLPKNRKKWVSTFVIHFFKSTCSAILLSVRSYETWKPKWRIFNFSIFSKF